MKHARTRILSLAALVLAVSACRSEKPNLLPLDGRTYKVEVLKADGTKETSDDLVFAGGTFDSSACRAYHFSAVPYAARSDGDAIAFEATAKSPTDGTNVWKGTVRGDAIEGELRWTDSKGKLEVLHWSGKLAR
jgi:hypothetical protein